jgi:type VI secretion system protein ImpG
MTNTAYYQDELRYLRDVGAEFARVNPEIARYLGERGTDPDVERILEGVAFLCGRLRHKLDDDLPEITANLMNLLWPHYVRPIPSMSVLELVPDIDALQAPFTVGTGAEFASRTEFKESDGGVGSHGQGTRCRYRSSWPTIIRPWQIVDVALDSNPPQPLTLRLAFSKSDKVDWPDMGLDRVRLYLAGDPGVSFLLYMLLAAHVAHVEVRDTNSENRTVADLEPSAVSASGLAVDDGVIPYPTRSFLGYRLLQEYFAFKNKFLFFDVRGLARAVHDVDPGDAIEIAIQFKTRPDALPQVNRQDVRLHCCPIINLFEHPAEPIRRSEEVPRNLLQPARSGVSDRRHLEIYSVDSVVGVSQSAGFKEQRYTPFFSFDATGRPGRFFHTQTETNVMGGDVKYGTDTYLSLVGAPETAATSDETISIETTCSNRFLPSELRAGDISEPTDKTPDGLRFRNIVKPTASISPPLGKGLHWRLISHMSLNYESLANAERFKELLRVYDYQAAHDARLFEAHERMFDGIVKLESRYGERLVRGASLRGTSISLELNEDRFAGEGDAFLFASILDRFFALYVTLNGYSQLSVRFSVSGREHHFPARWGDKITPAEGRE